MNFPKEGIYSGFVVHERLRPKKHRLKYSVFSLFLDLDQLENINDQFKMLSYNRLSFLSINDADHGDGKSIRSWVNKELYAAQLQEFSFKVYILCYPRIGGYVFNPLTVYFCYNCDGRLGATIYEVHNTFGGRHSYVLTARNRNKTILRQRCEKKLHVSPFIHMNCVYNFFVKPPANDVRIVIREEDADGLLFAAATVGNYSLINDRVLFYNLVRFPLMNLKVILGIHYEAAKLFIKGVPFLGAPKKKKKNQHKLITSSYGQDEAQ